jgi:hypothetical protein
LPPEVTVAVSATGVPDATDVGEAAKVVVLAEATVTIVGAEALAAKFVSPPYLAVN